MTTPVVLRNLTAHEIVLHADDGTRLHLPAAPTVPRLVRAGGSTTALTVQAVDGTAHPVTLTVGDRVTGLEPALPEPEEGVLLVTSRVVASFRPDRTDLVWPDDLLRDEAGRVVGARRLAALPR